MPQIHGVFFFVVFVLFFFCLFLFLFQPQTAHRENKKRFFKGHCEWEDNRAFPKKGYFLNELTILFGGISEKLV